MKKFLFSFLLLLIGYVCFSQVSFGVKSGINIATTKDLVTFPKNRVGWYAGVFSKIPVYKKFFFQPELLYSTKGYRTINPNDDSKTVRRLNYLTAPILLGYKIDKRTSLILGPELGYLLSAHLLFSSENFDVSKNYPVKLDVGLDVGLNYKMTKNIGIEIRYNYGFKNMYVTDAAGTRIGESLGGNRVFQIGVYYTLT